VELPADLGQRIAALFRRLQARPRPATHAVRSAPTAEGLPGASFAGQFQTFLDVQDAGQAGAAIRSCWASLWSTTALSYRAARPGGPAPGMAVLLQEFVPARVAGAARVDQVGVEVESTHGLGAAVMSGLVVPDYYVFGLDGRLVRAEAGRKPVQAVAEGGNLVWERLSEEQQAALSLDTEAAAEVCRLAQRAAARLGTPLEVEWLLGEDGQVWLLQGRRGKGRALARSGWTGRARAGEFRGIPAAPGEVVGPVRLVHGPEDLTVVGLGDVVVTRYASPEVAAQLRGAGLITEMGGVSSHAAAIARERQIPMVTGVLRITQVVRPGQLVRVDGRSGLVELLPEALP
jgi:pyruvate,water dikinase